MALTQKEEEEIAKKRKASREEFGQQVSDKPPLPARPDFLKESKGTLKQNVQTENDLKSSSTKSVTQEETKKPNIFKKMARMVAKQFPGYKASYDLEKATEANLYSTPTTISQEETKKPNIFKKMARMVAQFPGYKASYDLEKATEANLYSGYPKNTFENNIDEPIYSTIPDNEKAQSSQAQPLQENLDDLYATIQETTPPPKPPTQREEYPKNTFENNIDEPIYSTIPDNEKAQSSQAQPLQENLDDLYATIQETTPPPKPPTQREEYPKNTFENNIDEPIYSTIPDNEKAQSSQAQPLQENLDDLYAKVDKTGIQKNERVKQDSLEEDLELRPVPPIPDNEKAQSSQAQPLQENLDDLYAKVDKTGIQKNERVKQDSLEEDLELRPVPPIPDNEKAQSSQAQPLQENLDDLYAKVDKNVIQKNERVKQDSLEEDLELRPVPPIPDNEKAQSSQAQPLQENLDDLYAKVDKTGIQKNERVKQDSLEEDLELRPVPPIPGNEKVQSSQAQPLQENLDDLYAKVDKTGIQKNERVQETTPPPKPPTKQETSSKDNNIDNNTFDNLLKENGIDTETLKQQASVSSGMGTKHTPGNAKQHGREVS